MKHISRMLLALLALCLALTSCARLEPSAVIDETTISDGERAWRYVPADDEPVRTNMPRPSAMPYYDGGFFFYPVLSGMAMLRETQPPGLEPQPTLRRLDVETGEITDVCPDPLCAHVTPTCPFAGMNNRFFVDNEGNLIYHRLFFIRGKENFQQLQLCTYNLNTKEWRIHIDSTTFDMPSTLASRFISLNGYLYYYQFEYEEKEDGEKETVRKLVRENVENGKKDVLNDIYEDGILFAVNDRIYFVGQKEFYSTNLELEDKQNVYQGTTKLSDARTNGQYIFFSQKLPGGGPRDRELCRMDMDGGNLTNLGIPTGNGQWTITQNYIYYQRGIPETQLPAPDGSGAFTVNFDAIVRCDLNGENHEEIFVYNRPTEDEIPLYRVFIFMQPVGNYIYATEYGMIDKNKNGMCDTGEQYSYTSGTNMRITRIDVTTGEETYIEPYKDFQ